jgi:hypothetical protein
MRFFDSAPWSDVVQVPFGDSGAIAIGTDTKVVEIDTGGRNVFSVFLKNTGANPLTGAVVEIKRHPQADWVPYVGSADWANAATNDNIAWCRNVDGSQLPNALAAGAVADFGIWVLGVWAVKLTLTSAAGTTVIVLGNKTHK